MGELDSDRIGQMFLQHRIALLGFIRACGCNDNDAEDVLQNVFLAVMKSAGSLDDVKNFGKWARRIAVNRIREHFRQNKRMTFLSDEVLVQLVEAADRVEQSHAAADGRDEALRACLEELKEEERQIIRMRYGDPVSIPTMAQRFGKSVQATYAVLKRVRTGLRKCVESRLAQGG